MDFRGVDADTIENGHALNAAFLGLTTGPEAPAGLNTELRERLARLTAEERRRLARTPFLLYSLAFADGTGGRPAVVASQSDLFDDRMPGAESRLAAATLSLLWSLARTDRHAARFLSGISRSRCDEIADAPLVGVLDMTRRYETLVVPRWPERRAFWRKLLVSATDPRPFVRRAARQSALQCVLTELDDDTCLPVAAAACRTLAPTRQVAE